MFKVVPDQLRISDGWVRCGQCDEVFDANSNLHSEPPLAAPEVQPAQEPMESSSADPDWAASLRFASDEHREPLVETSVGDAAPTPAPELTALDMELPAGPQQEPPDSAQIYSDLDDFLAQSPKALAQSPGFDDDLPPLDTPAIQSLESLTGAAPRYTQTQAAIAEDVEPRQPSFMRKARGAGIWHTRGARAALVLLGLMLVLVLALQVALQERDRWAVYEPATVPALEALCDVMACTLSPLQNIDAVVIDSSSFTKVRSDVYRLNVALKNNGPVPLAPPALELTLTDMQDQSLVRRVLEPQEIGFKAATFAPGAEFSAVLPIAVKAGNPNERISGYRLLAFYP
jgi:predicted Zn finger-like uncharacterized protein